MITAVQEHHPLNLEDAPTGTRIPILRYLTSDQRHDFNPMRRYARRHGVVLPASMAGMVYPTELARVLELWENAPQADRDAELGEQRRRDREADADAAARRRQEQLRGLELTDRYLPAVELCNRFDIKPGTLRQWANRGHVRTDTQSIIIARGGYAKTGNDWEDAHGYRDVKVYHVGDTIDRARKSGVTLGEQHAPDTSNALRMLHHAYRECVRLNVPVEALSKHLLNLAHGDDSAYPALETDKDMGLA